MAEATEFHLIQEIYKFVPFPGASLLQLWAHLSLNLHFL